SVHYGSGSLSTKRREVKVDLSAGRDRLGSVGSPLEFKVESDVEYARNSIFKWNFGDGVEKIGDVLNHTYEYPGEYAVVLNVSLSQGKAVARLNVKIIEPEILITLATADRVEIKNDSQYEVSLFGRALVSGGKIFAFPQDTIIKAGQKISFSSPATGIAPTAIGDVSLVVVGTEVKPQQIMVKISEQKAEQIASIQTKIRELQQRLAVAVERENHNRATSNMVIQPAEEEELKESPQTALVLDAVQESRDTVSWLKTIQRFFLRTR
ncbi:MAG: PKD domain-containing protein, partial [Parcubacteria group bacterium]